jgi:hypothetical protein
VTSRGGILRAPIFINETLWRYGMWKLALTIGLGAAAWYWRNEIQSMVDTQFPGAREKAARTLDSAAQSAGKMLEETRSHVTNA